MLHTLERKCNRYRKNHDQVHHSKASQFSNLDDSVLFDIHRTSDHPQIIKLRDQLTNFLLKKKSNISPKRLKQHVTTVLINLWIVRDRRAWIAYSRDRNKYSREKRYNKLHIKYEIIIFVVDWLERIGFIENVKGFNLGIGNKGNRCSRMRPSLKLLDRFAFMENVTSKQVIEEIVLRDETKKEVDYHDVKGMRKSRNRFLPDFQYVNTQKMREDMKAFNEFLSRQIITLLDNLDHITIDFGQSKLHRVFSNGNFSQGGRYYGHPVQSLSKEDRSKLLINNEPVVELDYSALHINILYALRNEEPPEGDLYHVEGCDERYRPVLKRILLSAINAKNREEGIKAANYHFAKKRIKREITRLKFQNIRSVIIK